jgi:hypothetical protein
MFKRKLSLHLVLSLRKLYFSQVHSVLPFISHTVFIQFITFSTRINLKCQLRKSLFFKTYEIITWDLIKIYEFYVYNAIVYNILKESLK